MTSNLIAERFSPDNAGSSAVDRKPAGSDRALDPESDAGRLFGELAGLTGLPLYCVDSSTGEVLSRSETDLPVGPAFLSPIVLSAGDEFKVLEPIPGLLHYALALPRTDGRPLTAAGYALSSSEALPLELVTAAADENWSQDELDAWLKSVPRISRGLLQRMLQLTVGELGHAEFESALSSQVEDLTEQIEHTYEEISLLHSLTHNMQISRTPLELAEICVRRMESIIPASGHSVWIEQRCGGESFLVKGDLPFDDMGMARLISRFESHDWSRPIVKNHIQGTLLGADFPGLENLVIVSIAEGTHRFGWILSCNMRGGQEFGTVEANLLNSLATILGTHVRNIHLYEQHQDLLISFVRSLVSTLDAKDPYTRGHSERVALIARRLGETLELPDEDLHDIYLSGLLHDIGKIGVDDRILQKPGKLSDEEFRKIQEHPMIGYTILKELRNLQKVLPGVRSHHESYNGKGYPDGLVGEEIPLMARILAVADSYDAMGSDRPYRQGMPTEKIEEIFRRGSGEQWDARVIDAYFAASDDIQTICDTYSPTNGNLLPHGQPE